MQQIRSILMSQESFSSLIPFNNFTSLKREEICNKSIIELNNPRKMNSLDQNSLIEIYSVLTRDQLNTLIFKGNDNNKMFCSGANLLKLYDHQDNYLAFNNLAHYCFEKLAKRCEIAIWNGVVMGGGLGLSINSKYKIATETTLLAMPETKFGYFSNCFFTTFISKYLDYQSSLHFSVISKQINGEQSWKLGFATNFVLNKYIKDILSFLKGNCYYDEIKFKELLAHYQNKSILELGITDMYKDSNYPQKDLVNMYYNFKNFEEFYENIFRDKDGCSTEEKEFIHCNKKEISARSYLTLRVMFYVNQIAFINLNDEQKKNFELELSSIMFKSEQMEGIRAYFVEKDNTPMWKYNNPKESDKIFNQILKIKL